MEGGDNQRHWSGRDSGHHRGGDGRRPSQARLGEGRLGCDFHSTKDKCPGQRALAGTDQEALSPSVQGGQRENTLKLPSVYVK